MYAIKGPRLSKSKSNKQLARARNDDDDDEMTFKTSLEDLRNPDGRQSLRQHFTGAFPETQIRPSLETGSPYDSDGVSGLSRSASFGPSSNDMSSPSLESLRQIGTKRLSTVREANSTVIDVSQAIKLLEELKKTATAAELVALHKALLPSRDSALHSPGLPPSQEDLLNAPKAGFVRRRSMLPPGVATRNASGDLLKTPEEAAAEFETKRPSKRKAKKSAISALDLADGQGNTEFIRPMTPSDLDNLHIGAYRPGTLRVTNGTDSPEPGLVRPSLDRGCRSMDGFETAPSSPRNGEVVSSLQTQPHERPSMEDVMRSSAMQRPVDSAIADTAVTDDIRPTKPWKIRRASEPAKSGIPVPEERDDSAPRLYRPTRSERKSESRDRSREASRPRTGRSRTSSYSQLPLPVTGTPPKVHNVVQSEETEEKHAETQVCEDAQNMPRFAQRWSHRISFLPPPETQTDDQLPANPSDNNTALVNLSKRLSSVSDIANQHKEHSIITFRQMTDTALPQVNSNESEHPALRPKSLTQPVGVSVAVATVVKSAPIVAVRSNDLNNAAYGQGTESIGQSSHGSTAMEPIMVYKSFVNPQAAMPAIQKAYADLTVGHDEVSLYSFNQVLKSPHLLSGLAAPSPPQARESKKHLSLLGLTRGKRSGSASQAEKSASTESPNPSPPGMKSTKPLKKLQKTIPASIKADIKAQKKRQSIGERNASLVEPSSIPDVPQNVATSYFRRSQSGPTTGESITQPRETELTALFAGAPVELSNDSEVVRYHADIPEHNSDRYAASNAISPAVGGPTQPEYSEPRATGRAQKVDYAPYSPSQVQEVSTRSRSSTKTGYHSAKSSQSNAVLSSQAPSERAFQSSVNRYRTNSSAAMIVPPIPPVHPETRTISSALDDLASRQLPQHTSLNAPLEPSGFSTESVADAIKRAESQNKSLERSGYSNESVADAIKRAVQSQKPQRSRASQEGKEAADAISSKPQKSRSKKGRRDRTSEETQREQQEDATQAEDVKTISGSEEPQANWDECAKAWRQRRMSAGQTVGKPLPVDEQSPEEIAASRPSTSSIKSITRKPVPSTRNSASNTNSSHQRSESAEFHAEMYRELISHEHRERVGVEWRDSAGTFATIHSDDNENAIEDERIDSAYSTKPYLAPAVLTQRATSPGGRTVTSSGNYHPYTPPATASSDQTERYRAESLAQLTGNLSASASKVSTPIDVPYRGMHERNLSFGVIMGR